MPDSDKRRELIKRILTIRSNAVGDALVSRELKQMDYHRCPNCGVFTHVSYDCCPLFQQVSVPP